MSVGLCGEINAHWSAQTVTDAFTRAHTPQTPLLSEYFIQEYS